MLRIVRNNKGFTLVEIILSLVLFGFIALVAGMGIVAFTRGVIFAKESSHKAQKIQLAMNRLNREIMELTNIAAKDDTQPDPYVIYDNVSGRQAIAKDGDVIKMFFNLSAVSVALPSTGGNTLIDDVKSLTLNYYQDYQADPKIIWTPADGMALLTSIKIELELIDVGSEENPVIFSTLIFPRNR